MTKPLELVRAALEAFAANDRASMEALLADDYRFTSPLDNAIDRQTYMAICWPNSGAIDGFEIIHGVEAGDRAFVVYEARAGGKRFRNCEMHTARDGKLTATEVYFGWDLPHKAPYGEHIDNDGNE